MGLIWINPGGTGVVIIWCRLCPVEITNVLILETNISRKITNSDLKLASLVLHNTMLLSAISKAVVPVPWSRSDNTLDSSCSTHESSNINIVVDYLLCICTIHSIKFFFNPLSSNTPYRKLPWQMTPLTSSCWMALTFYPTCLLPTHNRKLCSVSTPRHHRSFCAWSPHCSGIRERGNYKICVTENYVQVVGRLLLHPVF